MANGYVRPRSTVKLAKTERAKLIRDNFQHYEAIAVEDKKLLSQKISGNGFKDVLDRMGGS